MWWQTRYLGEETRVLKEVVPTSLVKPSNVVEDSCLSEIEDTAVKELSVAEYLKDLTPGP